MSSHTATGMSTLDKPMDTPSLEIVPIKKNILIGELIKGRDSANQLQILLQERLDNRGSVSAEELVMKIVRSFSGSLSVLSSCGSGEVFQIPATAHVGSTCSGDRTSEESGESRKGPAGNDPRGCYKRRKTSDSRIKVSPTKEDGYAWRKYGQKEILKAKHPRCYFRCTHRNDQGCKARKQVQRMEDDSNMYHITYFGQHTCKNILKPTNMFSDPEVRNSYILSFESKSQNKKDHHHHHHHHPSCHIPSIARPVKEESKAQSELSESENVSSAQSTLSLWKEIIAMESPCGQAMMGFDHEDVVSSVHDSCASTSSHGLDMEILHRSVDFGSVLQFDDIEFS